MLANWPNAVSRKSSGSPRTPSMKMNGKRKAPVSKTSYYNQPLICMYVCIYIYIYIFFVYMLLFLDPLNLGCQTFRGSSTTPWSGRLSLIFFTKNSLSCYPFYEQSNYSL